MPSPEVTLSQLIDSIQWRLRRIESELDLPKHKWNYVTNVCTICFLRIPYTCDLPFRGCTKSTTPNEQV
jgi:hypothetical protein